MRQWCDYNNLAGWEKSTQENLSRRTMHQLLLLTLEFMVVILTGMYVCQSVYASVNHARINILSFYINSYRFMSTGVLTVDWNFKY